MEQMIQAGAGKEEIIRFVSRAAEGWPYVFGAWGEQCTPSARKSRKRDDHPTIVSACQVLSGKASSCSGCKWNLPVRMYDCRGFTHWLLDQVGINISGGGCTSQWNTKANWQIQGPISEMPKDRVCCVFTGTASKKEHTGMYLGDGSTVECSSGVQYFSPMKSKWKYYAIPAGLYGDQPAPEPDPDPDKKPTLRKGDSGTYVTLLQTMLIQRGYNVGSWGADGAFGAATEAAVKSFQKDHGLTADGIVGEKTWAALESGEKELYTVTIQHVSRSVADEIISKFGGTMTKE
jgi:hypothetical protein